MKKRLKKALFSTSAILLMSGQLLSSVPIFVYAEQSATDTETVSVSNKVGETTNQDIDYEFIATLNALKRQLNAELGTTFPIVTSSQPIAIDGLRFSEKNGGLTTLWNAGLKIGKVLSGQSEGLVKVSVDTVVNANTTTATTTQELIQHYLYLKNDKSLFEVEQFQRLLTADTVGTIFSPNGSRSITFVNSVRDINYTPNAGESKKAFEFLKQKTTKEIKEFIGEPEASDYLAQEELPSDKVKNANSTDDSQATSSNKKVPTDDEIANYKPPKGAFEFKGFESEDHTHDDHDHDDEIKVAGNAAQKRHIIKGKDMEKHLKEQWDKGDPPGAMSSSNWHDHPARVRRMLMAYFGYTDLNTYQGHSPNQYLAIDFMTHNNYELGDTAAAWLAENMNELGIDYIIWGGKFFMGVDNIYGPAYVWSTMDDRGSKTQNHGDHPHISFKEGFNLDKNVKLNDTGDGGKTDGKSTTGFAGLSDFGGKVGQKDGAFDGTSSRSDSDSSSDNSSTNTEVDQQLVSCPIFDSVSTDTSTDSSSDSSSDSSTGGSDADVNNLPTLDKAKEWAKNSPDIFYLGDSIGVGVEPSLAPMMPNVTFNVQSSRSLISPTGGTTPGMTILEQNKSKIKDVLVLSLGTNSANEITEENLQKALDTSGAKRMILVTSAAAGGGVDQSSGYKYPPIDLDQISNTMKSFASKKDNVFLVDWRAYSDKNLDHSKLSPDSLHYGNEGNKEYSEFLVRAFAGVLGGSTANGLGREGYIVAGSFGRERVMVAMGGGLTYNGVTMSDKDYNSIVRAAHNNNLLPSLLITQAWVETNWGSAGAGRGPDNNWSGMSYFESTDSYKAESGITRYRGSARPADEGGYYIKYNNMEDYFTDWSWLVGSKNYNSAGKTSFEEAVKGLFVEGGAQANYAASGYAHYVELTTPSRKGINEANGGILDKIDEDFKKGVKPSSDSSSSDTTPQPQTQNYGCYGSYWEPDEDAIPNMPSYREYETQVANGMGSWEDYTAQYLDPEQAEEDFKVGTEAAMSIAKWKEELSEHQHTSKVTISRRAIMLVGVFAAIGGVIFNILYVIDRLNPLGFSTISILTKGRVRSIGSEDYLEDVKDKAKYRILTDKNVFVWVAGFGFVASFLISGLAYEWLGAFLNYVINFFDKFGGLWK